MTAETPRFPLGIAMHNALYDASVPVEGPDGPPVPGDMPVELLAVLVKIETKPRTCEYLVGIPGFGLGTCARPATHYVTSHPCMHGGFACRHHLDAHLEAIGPSGHGERVVCVRCKPNANVSHVTYSELETGR